MTIVGDLHAVTAAAPNVNVDGGGSGIKRIFDQLFDHGGGPFNHFTGRDLGG
jgi:hypothetical protein